MPNPDPTPTPMVTLPRELVEDALLVLEGRDTDADGDLIGGVVRDLRATLNAPPLLDPRGAAREGTPLSTKDVSLLEAQYCYGSASEADRAARDTVIRLAGDWRRLALAVKVARDQRDALRARAEKAEADLAALKERYEENHREWTESVARERGGFHDYKRIAADLKKAEAERDEARREWLAASEREQTVIERVAVLEGALRDAKEMYNGISILAVQGFDTATDILAADSAGRPATEPPEPHAMEEVDARTAATPGLRSRADAGHGDGLRSAGGVADDGRGSGDLRGVRPPVDGAARGQASRDRREVPLASSPGHPDPQVAPASPATASPPPDDVWNACDCGHLSGDHVRREEGQERRCTVCVCARFNWDDTPGAAPPRRCDCSDNLELPAPTRFVSALRVRGETIHTPHGCYHKSLLLDELDASQEGGKTK